MIATAQRPAGAQESKVLADFDEVATKAIANAAPIGYRLATSDAEREATFRLRCQAVIDRGWAPASDFPDSIERDEFDDIAIHVGGWAGDELAATGRIVLPANGWLLPTEKAFGLIVEPRGQVP